MTSDAYDFVARAYADTFPDLRAEEPEEIALIDRFAELAGVDALALDAGCGAGRVSAHLRGGGLRVVGVDLSPGMLAMALRDQPWLPTAVATLTRLPLGDDTVDAVMFWYSTIHLDDDQLVVALAEASRVLRPGGHVLVGFQTGTGVREVGEGYRKVGLEVRMLRWHRTVEEMSRRLEDAGLRVVDALDRPTRPDREGQGFVLATLD